MKRKTFYLAGILALNLFQVRPSCAADINREFVKDILKINSGMTDIWPGYTVDRPILLYFPHDKLSYLAAHPNPPAGYSRSDGFGGERGKIYEKRGEMQWHSSFDLNYKLGGSRTVFFKVEDLVDLPQDINLFFHENFHVYQEKAFHYPEYLKKEDLTPEDLALFQIETSLLKRALISSGGEQLGLMSDFTAVRGARRAGMSANAVRYEDSMEAMEGSAEYVGVRSLLPPEAGKNHSLLAAPFVWERWDLLNLVNSTDASRYYMSGSLQMFVLDSLNIPWKNRLQNGRPISGIVGEYFGKGAAALADLKEEFGYKGLVEVAREAGKTRSGTNDRILEKYGKSRKIMVQLPPGVRGDGPRPYAKNIKAGKENLFSLAQVNVKAGGYLGLEIRSEIISWTGAEQPVRSGSALIHPSQYRAVTDAADGFTLALDGKPVVGMPGKPVGFNSIKFRNMEISLFAMCRGTVSKIGGDLNIVLLDCGKR